MASGKSRSNEEMAILSLDFLVGFAIFMATFIAVMTMCSGLLINLQSRTIDLDAVAYRTSVILVEDTGSWMASDVHWEDRFYSHEFDINETYRSYVKSNIRRLGLLGATDGGSGNYYLYDPASSSVALGPENITYSPLVLSERKYELFFNRGRDSNGNPDPNKDFSYEEIRDKAIFPPIVTAVTGLTYGYNYRFNVTLTRNDTEDIWSQGDPLPDPAHTRIGYIRRVVLIQNGTIVPDAALTNPEFPYIKIFPQDRSSPNYQMSNSIPIRLNLTGPPLNASRLLIDTPIEFRSFASGSLKSNTTDQFAYLDSYGPVINITNFSVPSNLQRIVAYANRTDLDSTGYNLSLSQIGHVTLFIDGSSLPTSFSSVYMDPFYTLPNPPSIPVNKELKIHVKKEFFSNDSFFPQDRYLISNISFECMFDSPVIPLPKSPAGFNFSYNYSSPTDPNGFFECGVGTYPHLVPAILEVWIW